MRIRFGRALRERREAAGISIGRFVLMVGMNKSYYIGIEQGRHSPTLDTVEKIAAGLGVTPADLLEGIPATPEGAQPSDGGNPSSN